MSNYTQAAGRNLIVFDSQGQIHQSGIGYKSVS